MAEFTAAMAASAGSLSDAPLSQAQQINELAACMDGLDNELDEEEDEEDEEFDLSASFWEKIGSPDHGLIDSSGCSANPLCNAMVACYAGGVSNAFQCASCTNMEEFTACTK